MQTVLSYIVFALLFSFLGVSVSGTDIQHVTPDALNKILSFGGIITLPLGISGAILIAIGLLLCFCGKRFFKLFLGLVGFCAGAILGFTIMAWIREFITITNYEVITYILAGVTGLILAAVCLFMWRVGVYLGAGLGGYALMSYILSLKVGGLIENEIGRTACLLIGVAVGVLAAIFLEDLAIAAASAITGALISVCGVDCYVQTGFLMQIYDQAIKRTFVLPEATHQIYYMYLGVAGLFIGGMLVQLLVAPSKGFGRGG